MAKVTTGEDLASCLILIQDNHWHYDFQKVILSSSITFLNASLMPPSLESYGVTRPKQPKEVNLSRLTKIVHIRT